MLNDDMKNMLAKQLPIQATTSKAGIPDIGPKRSLRVFDDNSLIYNETTGGQTLQNLIDGSKIAVAVIDREALDGYRFIGRAEIFDDGEVWEQAKAYAIEKGLKEPRCAVLIHIEAVFSLRAGASAGQKISI
ncbi:pyridoxamine 5'-phosphate oxidase family protein [Bartonella sp. HY329]|uniref:pyridoxamine 5'-phosphate oxidase family protein n=1 Tax=unclassified Bartonella TaxID=2645622 RepID=UPI0021C711D1|nr:MULTISPECIES: pyridoxamine 5'-phosphate oxidase family protein [unclassified Bartonella]UXM95917.1 pyridoxamine 5'-phosphate oxidase family protein [Bartonella sp. HY329]UXN10242.1 pyridoxamine 5'-phosphate oxidase family protein [Bartonella sp. HY328]